MKQSPIIYLASRFIPEGQLKDFLRRYYDIYKCGDRRKITFSQEGVSFEFREGNLKGLHILFPYDDKITYRDIRNTLSLPTAYFEGFNDSWIQEGSIFIDAGSFPGDIAMVARHIFGESGKVLALEPNPSNRSYLQKVVRANEATDKIEVLPYALAASPGQRYHSDNKESSKLINLPCDQKVNQVEAITLDNLLEEQGVFRDNRPIVVKMDIEGDELEAIEGAKRTLEYGARFAIAAYHIVDGQQTHVKLGRIFRNAGYHVFLGTHLHLTLFANPKE